MKKLLFIVLSVLAVNTMFAQCPIKVGQAQFNAGVGLSSWGIPVYAGLDLGVHKDVTIGGEVSYRGYRESYLGKKYSHSILGISGNANYHFNHVLKIPTTWDFYAGLNIGYYIWNSGAGYPGDGVSGLGLGGQVGGRYYFTDNVGINLEFGGGNAFSGGKFGLSIKL
jgi:outer membrane immunogenic protein